MQSYLRQATASQSRILGPFVDDTDFKTAETALTISNTDVKLMINGAASANKNSGGGTHRVSGFYSFTFDATDTATVGELEVVIAESGALLVKKTFWVLEEAVYDALFAAAAPGFATDSLVTAAANTILGILGTPAVTVSDDIGAISVGSGGLDAPGMRAALGLASANLDTQLAAIQSDADNIQTRLPAALVSGRIDASVGAMAANVMTAAAAASDLTTELQSGLATAANLATLAGYVDTEVAAIKAKTDNLPSDPADASVIAAAFAALNDLSQAEAQEANRLALLAMGAIE